MKENLKLYSVDSKYIKFLQLDDILKPFIIDSKAGNDKFPRKYLGVILKENGKNYFIPFSSPKKTDYAIDKDGNKVIRKNTLTIIRMTSVNNNGEIELKGTLKLNNMLPVPKESLSEYIIKDEKDLNYKDILNKEYLYIKQKSNQIIRNAQVLYNQKMNEDRLEIKPNYLNSTMPFKYAESKCIEYCKLKGLHLPGAFDQNSQIIEERKTLEQQLQEARERIKENSETKLKHQIKNKEEREK